MVSELVYISVRAHFCVWEDVVAFSIKDLAVMHSPVQSFLVQEKRNWAFYHT